MCSRLLNKYVNPSLSVLGFDCPMHGDGWGIWVLCLVGGGVGWVHCVWVCGLVGGAVGLGAFCVGWCCVLVPFPAGGPCWVLNQQPFVLQPCA